MLKEHVEGRIGDKAKFFSLCPDNIDVIRVS